MSANVDDTTTQVVVCSNCQTKNRVPSVANGVRRCGKCHQALRWIVNASDADFASIVEAATIQVLVDIWAPWCAPCRKVSPALEQLAGEFCGTDETGQGQRDESPEVSQRFEVVAIPTLLLMIRGEVIDKQVGAAPVPYHRNCVTSKLDLGA